MFDCVEDKDGSREAFRANLLSREFSTQRSDWGRSGFESCRKEALKSELVLPEELARSSQKTIHIFGLNVVNFFELPRL